MMQNPNFLILDEPTNDLDILTLNVLEDYLKAFEGCVVVVSHDRFFMDKIVDHLFVFEGNGVISDFPGNYTIYRNEMEEKARLEQKAQDKNSEQKAKTESRTKTEDAHVKKKLSFKEKREMEDLVIEIEKLEAEKEQLELDLQSGDLDHEQLHEKSNKLMQLKSLLDEKELRWLELSELS
jgi:ATP-binding cassette subfamily F protein uup